MIDSMAQYLDLAKEATNSKSDSNLARKIGVSRTFIGYMRHGHKLPSEELMLTLAKRAKLDETEALILLNLWKAEGEAKAIYKSLLMSKVVQAKDALKKSGVTIALVACLFSPLAGKDAQALEIAMKAPANNSYVISHNSQSNKHYAIMYRIIKAKLKRLCDKISSRLAWLLHPILTRGAHCKFT